MVVPGKWFVSWFYEGACLVIATGGNFRGPLAVVGKLQWNLHYQPNGDQSHSNVPRIPLTFGRERTKRDGPGQDTGGCNSKLRARAGKGTRRGRNGSSAKTGSGQWKQF